MKTKKTVNKSQSEKWFKPSVHTGWKKDMPAYKRRKLVLDSHKGNILASARAMNSLSNVTRDKETRKIAKADAQYFFDKYRKEKGRK